MTYTLYFSPGAASFAVHWMLLEIGAPFEAIGLDLEAGDQRADDYRRLNPQGRVPTLVVDGRPVRESAALLMLLAERHPEAGLAPAPNAVDRAGWLETTVFLANGMLPPMRDWFYADKDGDPGHADGVRALARRRIEGVWDRLDEALAGDRPYLVGEGFSTADILAVMGMRWSRNMPKPATDWTNLAPYIKRHRARPAFLDLCRREGLTDWVNPG